MTRRSTPLTPGDRDGTSQRARHLPALDPGSVEIDGRGPAELLAFVQALAGQLRFVDDDHPGESGTWTPFVVRDDVSIADIVAHMRDPGRFDGERARWLGRPHFALLLTFLELLGHARAQLNGLTRRHLDHYFHEVLHFIAERAEPDRVMVEFRLASRVAELRLPAGTALQAGRDSAGVPRVYRSERELIVNRARVAALRSVHVHRRITGIPDVRRDPRLSLREEILDRMLAIALGQPGPGDPVPLWLGAPVDHALVVGLAATLRFAEEHLLLEHHELRTLMQLVRRRAAADHEWAEINRLLGRPSPQSPRDFAANFAFAVGGPLNFQTDNLPQVDNLDDLYDRRAEDPVAVYIAHRLASIGPDNFAAVMLIKRRIDNEWAEINRILERVGRRRRGLLSWSLAPADPAAFATNLAAAHGSDWPPPWPPGTSSIDTYEAQVRALEAHLSMSAERLLRLVALAEQLPPRESDAWLEIDEILAEAHREQLRAARRQLLAATRGPDSSLTGLDAVVAAALGRAGEPLAWSDARPLLEQLVDRGHLHLLDYFRRQFVEPSLTRQFAWSDVDRVLELAQRLRVGAPEPEAREVEWRNLHAFDDATAVTDPEGPARWQTFGRRPDDPREDAPPTTTLGWALCSPALALSQGVRTLQLTLGLRTLDRPALLRGLGLAPNSADSELRAALGAALRIEVSTAKGFVALPATAARLLPGGPGLDYWTLIGAPRPADEDRPALQLELRADATIAGFAPLAGSGDPWPTLRLLLRQRWDAGAREWTTTMTPFAPLMLTGVHLHVEVTGLVDLQLQYEDRPLDPRRPFEPFGPQPAVGARLHIHHPELARPSLAALRFHIEWMGLPASLAANYVNYGIPGAESFRVRVRLADRALELPLADAPLLHQGAEDPPLTAATHTIVVPAVPITSGSPDAAPGPVRDLRDAARHLIWELAPIDFGHASYPGIAASRARDLAIALTTGNGLEPSAAYAVEPPYTPTIKRLSVDYQAAVEIDPQAEAGGADRLLHVHPFGVSAIDPADPSLLPRYDTAGELYIGLADLDPPRQLTLFFQVAEGTSTAEPEPVQWSALAGPRWLPLGEGLRHDATRGLINSGIVELALPAVAASTHVGARLDARLDPRLVGALYWLRLTVARDAAAVCDTVGIRAQAAILRFDDRGNAPDHYARPLPARTIKRLQEPDARIVAVLQPYTSFDGRPPEADDRFYTRVSERLRHKQRALTPWDYERLVLQRFARIYKAKCVSARDDAGVVDVIVIPDIRDQLPSDAFAPRAPANLLADIQAHLAAHAPAAARVRVRNAHYIAVSVRLRVRFVADQDGRYASQRLIGDLTRFLSPWAYDEGAELTISGKIYANSILDFVDRLAYVDFVSDLSLLRSDDGVNFRPVPLTDDAYHVATERPDQVLVAARTHIIDVVDVASEQGAQQSLVTGINFMKLGLDFTVS